MSTKSSIRFVQALGCLCAVWLFCAEVRASQVFHRSLRQDASRIDLVLEVQILRAHRTVTRMTLANGRLGPQTGSTMDYKARVFAVVYGKRTSQTRILHFRHHSIVPIAYDKQGRAVMHFSPILSGSGIEHSLKVKARYLLCFSRESFLRAEPPTRRQAVLQALTRHQRPRPPKPASR